MWWNFLIVLFFRWILLGLLRSFKDWSCDCMLGFLSIFYELLTLIWAPNFWGKWTNMVAKESLLVMKLTMAVLDNYRLRKSFPPNYHFLNNQYQPVPLQYISWGYMPSVDFIDWLSLCWKKVFLCLLFALSFGAYCLWPYTFACFFVLFNPLLFIKEKEGQYAVQVLCQEFLDVYYFLNAYRLFAYLTWSDCKL